MLGSVNILAGIAFLYFAYKYFESFFKFNMGWMGSTRGARTSAIVYFIIGGIANAVISVQSSGEFGLSSGSGFFLSIAFFVIVISFFVSRNRSNKSDGPASRFGKNLKENFKNSETVINLSEKFDGAMKDGTERYKNHRNQNEPMFSRSDDGKKKKNKDNTSQTQGSQNAYNADSSGDFYNDIGGGGNE